MESMESFLQNPLPKTISELREQISILESEQRRCVEAIKELTAREDVPNGISFPREIHEFRQQKNMLETHIQYRRVKIARLSIR